MSHLCIEISACARAGAHVEHAIQDSLGLARVLNVDVKLSFNDTILTVTPNSLLDDLIETYWASRSNKS